MKLSVKDLTARYSSSNGPVYAVEDVDFDLEDGQSIGIAGESACGKAPWGYQLSECLQVARFREKSPWGANQF